MVFAWLLLMLSVSFLLFTGCASQQVSPLEQDANATGPAWPAPPLAPRIVWVGQIRGFEDTSPERGLWKRFARWISGTEKVPMLRPRNVLVDGSGRLFVVDAGEVLIHVKDLRHGGYYQIGRDDGNRRIFRSPVDVAEADDGNLYITDSAMGKIFRFNLKTRLFETFTPFSLNRPSGIAFNRKNGLLYCVETGEHRIVALDLSGRKNFHFGARGSAPGMFNFPTDITVGPSGNVYVTDALNARIQVFSPDGQLLFHFGHAGNSSGSFAKPKGVALDSEGHIYVSDALFDAVQIFDDRGRLLLDFGSSGRKPGNFWLPSGIFIDDRDYIYIADSYNQRLQIFRYLKQEVP